MAGQENVLKGMIRAFILERKMVISSPEEFRREILRAAGFSRLTPERAKSLAVPILRELFNEMVDMSPLVKEVDLFLSEFDRELLAMIKGELRRKRQGIVESQAFEKDLSDFCDSHRLSLQEVGGICIAILRELFEEMLT